MKKDVTKKTVKYLSELTTGDHVPDVEPPSVSFFIKKINAKYLALIAQAEIKMMNTSSNRHKDKYLKQKERYCQKLEKFKKLVEDIPDGFSLAPVMYTRISGGQNKKIEKEFSTYARPRFMIYLAENHSDDLKNIGLCEYAIGRMKKGLEPADKDWNFYNLTVDHIIERSGSGKLGYQKKYDRKTGQYMRPTYQVNHFANLILMPHDIHSDIKNFINEMQNLPSMNKGSSLWSLSLVPTGDTLGESSVYVAKSKADRKKIIKKNKRSIKTQIGQLIYLSKQLDVEAKLFLEFYGKGLRGEQDIKSKNIKSNSLADSFNGKEQATYIYNRRIKPLINEMTDILNIIDSEIELAKNNGDSINKLSEQLKNTLYALPLRVAETRLQDIAKLKGEPISTKFTNKRFYMLGKYCNIDINQKKNKFKPQ